MNQITLASISLTILTGCGDSAYDKCVKEAEIKAELLAGYWEIKQFGPDDSETARKRSITYKGWVDRLTRENCTNLKNK